MAEPLVVVLRAQTATLCLISSPAMSVHWPPITDRGFGSLAAMLTPTLVLFATPVFVAVTV